jgi:hypothetical protein
MIDKHFIESILVSDHDGNTRMFTMDYNEGKRLLGTYDTERHRRYDDVKDTDVVFKVANSFQCVSKWEWKVN